MQQVIDVGAQKIFRRIDKNSVKVYVTEEVIGSYNEQPKHVHTNYTRTLPEFHFDKETVLEVYGE